MKDVVIYTSDGCQYCHAAKDYMDENNVKYTEKNISQDQDRLLRRYFYERCSNLYK